MHLLWQRRCSNAPRPPAFMDERCLSAVNGWGGSDPRRKLQHSPALRRSETPTQRAHGQDHRRMTRAVIYARFSTELQNEKSTENQIALCRAYANRQKIDVIATFEDRARSGASVFGRDGLMQLMDAARQRLFDVVIVEALDRLSRASFVRTPTLAITTRSGSGWPLARPPRAQSSRGSGTGSRANASAISTWSSSRSLERMMLVRHHSSQRSSGRLRG